VGANLITSFYYSHFHAIFFHESYICIQMAREKSVLAVDAGNTVIKVGLFDTNELLETKRFILDKLGEFQQYIQETKPGKYILSSVLSDSDTQKIKTIIPSAFHVLHSTPLPFKIGYNSPHSLGIDRICNVSYCQSMAHGKFAVCIDIGTCIKFDVIDANNIYLGGSISPGIDLRYKALHHFTGKLPLLSNKDAIYIVGNNTLTSIQSGVLNGIKAEIEGFMRQYRTEHPDLTFFVTGGDAGYFDLESKNDIFADENLTLKGLYEIFKYNA
jgi:type III pantothenate kinase